ncbi:MAG TPA: hypothetical protein VI731_04920 [Bacteroidia bacterium]|nr:hypothetical protein [Bacteroidia bacterium]
MRLLLTTLITLLFYRLIAGNNDPLGARSAGMAGSGVALNGDLWSVQNNPAGLASIKTFQAGVFYESRFLVNDLAMKAAAAAIPTKQGVFGITVSSFGLGNLYSENKAGVGFSKSLGPKFSAAIQMDYFHTSIAENYGTASTVCGEIGLIAEPVSGLKLGFHVFNPTRSKTGSGSDQRLPTIMRLGGLYSFSEQIFVTVEAEKDIAFKPVIRGGLEYRPANNFYIRAGAASNPGLMTFGFGIVMKKIRLDVASSFHSVLGFSPSVGLQYGFE